ncbi:hypothetical protein [Mesoterricola sediminis]|uniref:Outer membrane protein beta-barrel domain-containing protein n=1 Tax=Mesoterricola sediminis TaxID=2927980 RepID=A0AA48KCJ6_9BACT|nr:hypothetical protein [Mesoterricola sediminis]BDU76115.1 hypothetical protein METESE_10730 [Mesoterricola sediminis]
MKKAAMFLPLLVVLPLSANTWEAGVFIGQQSFRSQNVTLGGNTFSGDVDNKVTYGFRVGRSVLDFGPALLEVTAGFQPESRANATIRINGAPFGTGEYKTQHFSIGAMANLKAFVALGAGVEYRFEKLDTGSASTTYARPWIRVNAGIAIPSPVVKPFVGVEAAVPVTSKSVDATSPEEDQIKALAPKFQIGLYAGIRF